MTSRLLLWSLAIIILVVVLVVDTESLRLNKNLVLDIEATVTGTANYLDLQKQLSSLDESKYCTSLTGPFCVSMNEGDRHSENHMGHVKLEIERKLRLTTTTKPKVTKTKTKTKISGNRLETRSKNTKTFNVVSKSTGIVKKCQVQLYPGHWMDRMDDQSDIHQQVTTSADACARLCCHHAQCRSYTWYHTSLTCFLRSKAKRPRVISGGPSDSGTLIIE